MKIIVNTGWALMFIEINNKIIIIIIHSNKLIKLIFIIFTRNSLILEY